MQYWLAFSWPYNLLSDKVLRITVYSCANEPAGPHLGTCNFILYTLHFIPRLKLYERGHSMKPVSLWIIVGISLFFTLNSEAEPPITIDGVRQQLPSMGDLPAGPFPTPPPAL